MGSYRGNCEIVEAKGELSPIRRPRQTREQRPPLLNKGPNKSWEDDINKLFESVNIRTSKSLDLSDWRRNASKKPIRAAGSHSPGIGFSEPVSLKQALRGLCISQAAEMAAVKRLSIPPASPRISETRKMSNLYMSNVVVEAGGCSSSPGEGGKSTSSAEKLPTQHQNSVIVSATQSSCLSPILHVEPITKITEFSSGESFPRLVQCGGDKDGDSHVDGEKPASSACNISHHHLQVSKTNPVNQTAHSSSHKPNPILYVKDVVSCDSAPISKVDKQFLETVCSEEHNPVCAFPQENVNDSKSDNKFSGPVKVSSCSSKDSSTPTKVLNKAAPKVRRKSRLQTVSSSSPIKVSKDVKLTRGTSRAIKPMRNKNLIIKKSKKVSVSNAADVKTSYEVNSSLERGSGQMICQRCQCSLKDTSADCKKDPPSTATIRVLTNNSGLAPTGWESGGTPVIKTCITSKFSEKGDISQSSKSSICDFSSSTTSLSDESNLSGSTFDNRPHMSKDLRWQEINRVRRQYGFLGLNHFNLIKKLGSGDIGTVYLAELIGTNCPFAIKVMDNEFLARRKKLPRARTEREILRMLDHPFLPTLYNQFTSDNLSCLVMEFCPGGDLHVLRQKQPGRCFPEQAARFYVAEVLLALEYLHMLGIVYRDLKPENILVRENGHIMLTDFDLSLRCSVNPTLVKASSLVIEPPRISGQCSGSNCIDPFCSGPSCKVSCFSPRLLPAAARSRRLKADSVAFSRSLPQLVVEPTDARSNSFVGTHEYLAPEIIKGDGHGSAVDWWTFGVFLYELLYGRTPFKGDGNEETLTNVVLQNLKFPDTPIVSFQARDLIRGLLVKDPENRLGTQTGAAEIKRHPFFDGLNWALIRCAVPPQVPEVYEAGNQMAFKEKGTEFMEYSANGEHLEFELF